MKQDLWLKLVDFLAPGVITCEPNLTPEEAVGDKKRDNERLSPPAHVNICLKNVDAGATHSEVNANLKLGLIKALRFVRTQ